MHTLRTRSWFRRSAVTAALALSAAGCGGAASDAVENEELVGADETAAVENALTGNVAVGATLVTTTSLNLRTGPGVANGIITVMPGGAAVTALQGAPTNGWYNIRYQTRTGWASGAYLRGAAAAPTPPPSGNVTISGPAVRAHVRAYANAMCSVTGCGVVGTRVGHSPSADRALDFMVNARGIINNALGDNMSNFAFSRWPTYRLTYIIWRQRINFNNGRGWSAMADRGSITANHYDHVHISFNP